VDYNERRKQLQVGDIYSLKEDRLAALGTSSDFPQDKLISYMAENAETLFEPKKIKDEGDWLLFHKEVR
jgi:archaemetzincin